MTRTFFKFVIILCDELLSGHTVSALPDLRRYLQPFVSLVCSMASRRSEICYTSQNRETCSVTKALMLVYETVFR